MNRWNTAFNFNSIDDINAIIANNETQHFMVDDYRSLYTNQPIKRIDVCILPEDKFYIFAYLDSESFTVCEQLIPGMIQNILKFITECIYQAIGYDKDPVMTFACIVNTNPNVKDKFKSFEINVPVIEFSDDLHLDIKGFIYTIIRYMLDLNARSLSTKVLEIINRNSPIAGIRIHEFGGNNNAN